VNKRILRAAERALNLDEEDRVSMNISFEFKTIINRLAFKKKSLPVTLFSLLIVSFPSVKLGQG